MTFKFKKGDKVRVNVFDDEYCAYGELLTVDENDDVPYCITSEGKRYAMNEDELDLVERKTNIFSRFYNWVMYDGVQEEIENLREDHATASDRLDDLEETMEKLLAKLGVHVKYTVNHDIFSDKEFDIAIVDNEIVKVKKTKTPKTKKASTDRSKTGGKK